MGSNRNNNDRKVAQVNAALMHAAAVNLKEQYSTKCNAGYAPIVDNSSNNIERTPVAARAWHHTAMSAATFTLSALLGYIATEAICKRIRGRN